jgi:hypothetical protein
MPSKGTVDYDLSHDAWINVDGKRCYVQRTVLFGGKTRPDAISFPHKYMHKLPCLVQINQRYASGELMYPDLYILRKQMVITKEKREIQAGKCDGYIIPINELEFSDVETNRR